MMGVNTMNCPRCNNVIKVGEWCDMCGLGKDSVGKNNVNPQVELNIYDEKLKLGGWDTNKIYRYTPHVHVKIDESMVKNLITDGKVMIILPDGTEVELKYSGPKIIDFQIHKVNIESVEDV